MRWISIYGGFMNQGRLVISCRDRSGILAAVTGFLHGRGANIVQLDQHSTDLSDGRFYLRLVFHLPDLSRRLPEMSAEFAADVGSRFAMRSRFRDVSSTTRVAIFASRQDHCLLDLLWRWRRGDLPVDVKLVVANHPNLADSVAVFGVPFRHIPTDPQTRPEAERRQLELLHENVDLVILARYMQILSGEFLDKLDLPIINIHHSFLPAFAGASPYERARRRGVKLVGATAHYVTADLDEGPIIEQDVVRVSHRDSAGELARRGADVERGVLGRAVRWHCEDRVIVDGNTTIVF
jgi:formyltetrahydrofolate deformylase